MKAAVLNAFGSKLSVESVPDPLRGTGEVIVDVVAAPVLHYADEVFSGQRKYLLNLPAVPGCGAIGRVRSVGPDATKLTVGDWVLCDPTVRSRDNALTPDITLQGWSAREQSGLRLQDYFHDGPFAEQIRVPTENAIRIGSIGMNDGSDGASQWCASVTLLVPYGGLLAAELQAGETVLVSGATGNFGSSAVAVALAMGAGCVIAPGRNETVLEELVRRFGPRVRPVKLVGDEAEDRKKMMQAAPGAIDCVLDLMPPEASSTAVRAALMSVRPYGRVILMGGVAASLELPYPWIMRNLITVRGQWMYSPDAVTRLASLIRAGLLDLSQFSVTEFRLDEANEAVAHASANARPFNLTVIRP